MDIVESGTTLAITTEQLANITIEINQTLNSDDAGTEREEKGNKEKKKWQEKEKKWKKTKQKDRTTDTRNKEQSKKTEQPLVNLFLEALAQRVALGTSIPASFVAIISSFINFYLLYSNYRKQIYKLR